MRALCGIGMAPSYETRLCSTLQMRSNSSKRIMAHKTVFWVEAKNVYFLIRFTLR
jgi:hypothetical protein